jgi:hypothetical protein
VKVSTGMIRKSRMSFVGYDSRHRMGSEPMIGRKNR